MATRNDDDLLRNILGLDLDPQRQGEVMTAFGDILREIEKLRTLDLSDVHPAVVFLPVTQTRDGTSELGKADAS